MSKKAVDVNSKPVGELVTTEMINEAVKDNLEYLKLSPAAQALINSNVITLEDGAVSWRMGHLLHIANLYKGNPAQTERDYADDLAVARAYSADVWEALIK